MVDEKRLIDANKAKAVLLNMAEHLMEAGNPEMAGSVGYAAELIGKQKTVDAVEVVRCKDCKYWNNPYCNHSESTMLDTQENNFCSYGKRREGE